MDNFNNHEDITKRAATGAGKKAAGAAFKFARKGAILAGKGLISALSPIIPYIIVLLLVILAAAILADVARNPIKLAYNYLSNNAIAHTTQTLKQWCETEGQNLDISETDALVLTPNDILTHIEIEEKSIPANKVVDVKVETITEHESGKKNIETSYLDYDLNLFEAAYPYRTYYTMTLAVENLYNIRGNTNILLLKVLGREYLKQYLETKLKTIYSWSHDNNMYQYTKDVSNITIANKKTYKNGKLVDETETKTTKTTYYPLPYLDSVRTAFKSYIFKYKEDVITRDDPFEVDISTETNHIGNDNYRYITTTSTKTVVKEDFLTDIIQEDVPTFNDVLKSLGINNAEDYQVLAMSVKELPDAYDFIENLSEYGPAIEYIDSDNLAIYNKPYIASVPAINGDWKRTDLVNTALSLLDLPYFWGGKYYQLGPCPEWGTLKTVTSEGNWSYGQKRRYGLDCSGFVTWLYNQILLPVNKTIVTGAANQFYSIDNGNVVGTYRINESELKPGDLGFNSNLGHVGIYIGKIDGEDAFVHAGGRTYATEECIAGRVVISYNNTNKFYKGNPPTKFALFCRVNVNFIDD